MTDFITNYINLKKIHKEVDLKNFPFIEKSLLFHSELFDDCEIIPICSTDIFPETITYKQKKYILYDINYARYVEHMYNNIQFFMYLLSQDSHEQAEQLLNNIKSDAYHFLSLKEYHNPILSLQFIKTSKELFNPLSIHRVADTDDILFFEILNMYIMRHENAHHRFSCDTLSVQKNQLRSIIHQILELLKSGKIQPNPELRRLGKNYVEEADNTIIVTEIEQMLRNYEQDVLFEELFCDYVSFLEILSLYKHIYSNENPLLICVKIQELLSILDYITDYYRRIAEETPSVLSETKSIIRHSINHYIKSFATIEVIYSGKSCIEHDKIRQYLLRNRYEKMDKFQDVFFKYLLNIVIEVRNDKITKQSHPHNTNSIEKCKIERDKILKW